MICVHINLLIMNLTIWCMYLRIVNWIWMRLIIYLLLITWCLTNLIYSNRYMIIWIIILIINWRNKRRSLRNIIWMNIRIIWWRMNRRMRIDITLSWRICNIILSVNYISWLYNLNNLNLLLLLLNNISSSITTSINYYKNKYY